MDIEGLGESVVVQLIDKKLVQDCADIYFLKKNDLLLLELFADKKADNLCVSIEKSKQQPLSRFIFGLGIINVGEKASALLAQNFSAIEKLAGVKADELEHIHEIGQVIAQSVTAFFKQSVTRKLIAKFKRAGLKLKENQVQAVSDKLAGQKFVFTGELESLSRLEAKTLVRNSGGDVISSVSKNTNYVVAGTAPGSKYQKALKLGVTILNEKQFQEMING